jgi:hypothetical protein
METSGGEKNRHKEENNRRNKIYPYKKAAAFPKEKWPFSLPSASPASPVSYERIQIKTLKKNPHP